MAYIMKILFFLIFILFASLSFSDEITMAFGESIPPFSFPESNTGIELEIISEALAFHKHTLTPIYYPLARVPIAFKQKKTMAAMTDLGQDMGKIGAFYGDSAVVYNNVFITLKEKQLLIKKPEDLENLSVISFQGALKRYPRWLEPVKKAKRYHEQHNQLIQVLVLNKKRLDVVLSDISIFKYYSILAEKEYGEKLKEFQIHHFVEPKPNDYRPVFWSESIRDNFNDGIAYLKQTGRYQAIYDKYLQK
mgnify:CR=1 FL=1